MSISKRLSLLLLSTSLLFTSACSDDTLLEAAIEFIEIGSVSQATTSRRTTKSPLLLSAPTHTLGMGEIVSS